MIKILRRLLFITVLCGICWNCTEITSQRAEQRNIVKTDSIFHCSNLYKQNIIKGDSIKLVIYIEGDYCASCHAKLIYSVLSFLEDSLKGGYGKPIMFWHPKAPNMEMKNMCLEYFGTDCELFFTQQDSIRDLNSWMDPRINIYGIIIGPSNEMLYAGFLYDERFLMMAKVIYEKKSINTKRKP